MSIDTNIANIVRNIIELAFAVGTTLVMRYLLEISTPEEDIKWIKRQSFYIYISALKFYRGVEFLHQLRGRKLLLKYANNPTTS
jgi:hypothetical protein